MFNQLTLTCLGINLYAQNVTEIARAADGIKKNQHRALMLFTHASNIDGIAASACMGGWWSGGELKEDIEYTAIAKRELLRVPVLGWFLSLGGLVPIDRVKLGEAIAVLKSAGQSVLRGVLLGVSPEGTRRRSPSVGFDSLLPFKKGPFHMIADVAREGVVSVVPVIIAGSNASWPGLLPIPGSTLCVRFGAPVKFSGTIDVTAASLEMRDAFKAEYIKLNKGSSYSVKEACNRATRIDLSWPRQLALQMILFWPLTALFVYGILKLWLAATSLVYR